MARVFAVEYHSEAVIFVPDVTEASIVYDVAAIAEERVMTRISSAVKERTRIRFIVRNLLIFLKREPGVVKAGKTCSRKLDPGRQKLL